MPAVRPCIAHEVRPVVNNKLFDVLGACARGAHTGEEVIAVASESYLFALSTVFFAQLAQVGGELSFGGKNLASEPTLASFDLRHVRPCQQPLGAGFRRRGTASPGPRSP